MITIKENGIFHCPPEDYGADKSLYHTIADYLIESGARSVLDIGCGNGDCVKVLDRRGLYARGVDGNPLVAKMCELCATADISKPVRGEKFFDAVISLEVGEHIPKEFEFGFLFNLLHSNPKQIVLSWFPHDGEGIGHVNPKTNDEVKLMMGRLSYVSDDRAEARLRSAATHWWFKLSLMAFKLKA
jgi:SAM-dependent methyltransferase